MQSIQLILPTPAHEADATAFAREVMEADGDGIHGSHGLFESPTFASWLAAIARSAAGAATDHSEPADTFFAVRASGGGIVGIINIRHALSSEFMRNIGGHIGYTVRPSARRCGVAKQMLRQALDHCLLRGIPQALLTTDPSNAASRRTIEACGGVYESEIPFPGTDEWVRRYWCPTAMHTERLTIGLFEESMAASVHRNSLDADTRRFLPDEVFATYEEALDTVRALMASYGDLSRPQVFPLLLAGGENIGYVQAVPLDDGAYEVGYHVAHAHTGKGYATEALRAFAPAMLRRLGATALYGVCRADNLASRRVLEKCGFVSEDVTLRDHKGIVCEVCRYRYPNGQGGAQ